MHRYHAVLMSYILAESGWSWSLWITSCIPWFSSSMCCRWWYLDVLSYRHGSACWGQCRSLFFQVSLILHNPYRLPTAWLRHFIPTISVVYTCRYGSYPVRGKFLEDSSCLHWGKSWGLLYYQSLWRSINSPCFACSHMRYATSAI